MNIGETHPTELRHIDLIERRKRLYNHVYDKFDKPDKRLQVSCELRVFVT